MTIITSVQPPVVPGEILSFNYPKYNSLNARRIHYSSRVIQVTQVRDTARKYLSSITIRKRPMLNRGRWLISGLCLESNKERSFYWESMKEHSKPTFLTLGLFDPIDPDPDPIFTKCSNAPTKNDREFMSKVIEHYELMN